LRFLDWPDSDMAMAMACLRLVTFFPELLLSLPTFFSCMTFSTFRFCCAVAIASLLKDISGETTRMSKVPFASILMASRLAW
jgi:hypothetical protein